MAAVEILTVDGLDRLEQTLKSIDVLLDKKPAQTLREIAEPVRGEAERLALAAIPHIGLPWSRMRVGFTTESVYVAPVQRGRKSRVNPRLHRRNFANLLLDRAMEPALARNEPKVVAALDGVLADIERAWGSDR